MKQYDLQVGDRVYFADAKRLFKVRNSNNDFAILTKLGNEKITISGESFDRTRETVV